MKKLITLFLVLTGIVCSASADNYLKGSWDSWAETAHPFVFDSNGYGTVTISNLAASTTYEFGIQDGSNFWAYNGKAEQITSSNCKNWTLYNGDPNSKIITSVAGDYTFKLKWIDGKPHLWVVYPTSETYTIHFQKGNAWESVWAYRFFNGSDVCDVKWYGTQISENANNSGFYDVTFNDSFDRIAFSDAGDGTNKSGDVEVNFSYPETWVTDNATISTSAPTGWIGYTRSVTSGNFGTICLPFAATISGATVYEISGKVMDGETLKGINLTSVDKLSAGIAYIFKATSSTLTATYSGSYTAASAGNGMMGNLGATTTAPIDSYVVGSDNKMHLVTGSSVNVGQNRGWITLDGIGTSSSRSFDFISFDDDVPTGIESMQVDDNQHVIFNLQGQRVMNAKKGVFILNGKKMLIK